MTPKISKHLTYPPFDSDILNGSFKPPIYCHMVFLVLVCTFRFADGFRCVGILLMLWRDCSRRRKPQISPRCYSVHMICHACQQYCLSHLWLIFVTFYSIFQKSISLISVMTVYLTYFCLFELEGICQRIYARQNSK